MSVIKDQIMSKVIAETKTKILWYSKGDAMPYWTSDKDGTEIQSFATKKEALQDLKKELVQEWRVDLQSFIIEAKTEKQAMAKAKRIARRLKNVNIQIENVTKAEDWS